MAVLSRQVDRARALLDGGADPNAPNTMKRPPLQEAALRGQPEMVALLLDHGARVNATDAYGTTALVAATEADLYNDGAARVVNVLKVLLDRGANLNHRGPHGETALTAAMRPYGSPVVRFLLDRGADMNASGPPGMNYTPLHYAAFAGNLERLKARLNSGTDVNARDAQGDTPLLLAAMADATDVVAALIEAGSRADVRNAAGETPLTAALRVNNPDAAMILIQHGANPNAPGQYGETPLIMALGLRTSMPQGRDTQVRAVIMALLEHGADVNLAERGGRTPLGAAVSNLMHTKVHVEVVGALMDRGANPNAHSAYQIPVLFLCIDPNRKDIELPRLLLDRGADPNLPVTERGETVLVDAVQQRDFTFADLLLDRGANVSSVDSAGKTALLWSAYYGREDLVKKLLARGASLNEKDKLAQTAVALAIKGGHSELAEELRKLGGTVTPLPTVTRNARGQPFTTIKVPLRAKPSTGPVIVALNSGANPFTLALRQRRRVLAEGVRLDPLFSDPALFTAEERNDNIYQVNSGYFAPSAYRIFGAVELNDRTYLGIMWYSPAASDQHDTYGFVCEVSLVGSALRITVLRRISSSGETLPALRDLPLLKRSPAGALLLTSSEGVFQYLPDGRWKRVGQAPKRPKQ